MKSRTSCFIIILMMTYLSANSCSCLSSKPEEAFKTHSVVFIGKLVSTSVDSNLFVSSEWGSHQVKYWTFEVRRYVKGLEHRHSRVSILSTGTNCDYSFDSYSAGTEFIIYAYRLNETGRIHFLSTNQCSQTKLVSEVEEDFELKMINDPSYWKTPEPLNPKFVPLLERKYCTEPSSQSARVSWSNVLIVLNLGLTIYLVIRTFKAKRKEP